MLLFTLFNFTFDFEMIFFSGLNKYIVTFWAVFVGISDKSGQNVMIISNIWKHLLILFNIVSYSKNN